MAFTATPGRTPFGHVQRHLNDSSVEENNGGEHYAVKLAVDYTTADAAVLFTLPYRSLVIPDSVFMEIITGFSGGSSSAIGLSSSQAPHDTKGDVYGGTAGLLTAVIGTAGLTRGTQGLSLTAAPFCIPLEAGATIRFDRIASVYTAGAGFIHMAFRVIG